MSVLPGGAPDALDEAVVTTAGDARAAGVVLAGAALRRVPCAIEPDAYCAWHQERWHYELDEALAVLGIGGGA